MAKTYMDVEDLEVYQRLCKLHIEVCGMAAGGTLRTRVSGASILEQFSGTVG